MSTTYVRKVYSSIQRTGSNEHMSLNRQYSLNKQATASIVDGGRLFRMLASCLGTLFHAFKQTLRGWICDGDSAAGSVTMCFAAYITIT